MYVIPREAKPIRGIYWPDDGAEDPSTHLRSFGMTAKGGLEALPYKVDITFAYPSSTSETSIRQKPTSRA